MNNIAPSRQPGASEDETGQLRQILNKFGLQFDVMIPARIKAYDRETNRAQVQPQIDLLLADNTTIPRSAIVSIPVQQFGGGGFILSTPLEPDDLGYILACDRDWSVFLQNYEQSGPASQRSHTFEDGLFLPDPMTGYAIADDGTFVLQTLDGNGAIIMAKDPDSITLKVGNSTLILTDGTLQLSGAVLDMTGNDINNIAGVSANYSGHTHTGVTTGGSSTQNVDG